MLSKERETGTILVYVNNFSDPNILKTILNMISKSPKKIFILAKPLLLIIQFQLELMMRINYRRFLKSKSRYKGYKPLYLKFIYMFLLYQ